jgi:uncharacterized membrane protein
MTKRDVLSISLKIVGVYSVIYAVRLIPNFALAISMVFQQSRQNPSSFWFLAWSITAFVLALAATYILLRWGDSIAKKLIKENSEISAFAAKDWEKSILNLSLRIIGVVCLIRGIPELFNSLIRLTSLGAEQRFVSPNYWGGLISAIVLLIIGAYLISGGKKLIKFTLPEPRTASSGNNR